MPNSGQKRTAANEPSGSIATGAPKVKRTRFASPSSEPVNFEEQVDATLENPSAARKGRVKTEGYDSDSSDDGEGVVESRKKSAKKDEDEDEDMFAAGGRSDNEENGAGKKKDKEYLKLGDIEGQVFADEKAAHGSADEISSEDEPEDEDDAERRRKAGMGYELSSFNMREEMEEGKFDADGTFLRTFDPHGVHDRWMEGVDEREIKKARRNKKIREREERERVKKEEDEAVDKEDAERELIGYLRKGETVLEALQRLGIAAKKDKHKQCVALYGQFSSIMCHTTVLPPRNHLKRWRPTKRVLQRPAHRLYNIVSRVLRILRPSSCHLVTRTFIPRNTNNSCVPFGRQRSFPQIGSHQAKTSSMNFAGFWMRTGIRDKYMVHIVQRRCSLGTGQNTLVMTARRCA